MKTFELQGQTYDLPEGWHEVSLGLFEKMVLHSQNLPEYKSNLQFALEMLAILLDIDVETIKRLNKTSFDLLSQACEWTNQAIVPTTKKQFEIDGQVYVPINNFSQITMGEQIDLELMIADSKGHEVLTNILPILIRKAVPKIEGEKTTLIPSAYDSSTYRETRELFRNHLMVSDVIDFKDRFFFGEKQ